MDHHYYVNQELWREAMNCKRCGRFPCVCADLQNAQGAMIDEPIRHYTSGASTSGNKPPYECLTFEFLRRAAERMRKGLHYGKHNWKKGAADKAFILDRLNHAIEHLKKAQEEIDNDIHMNDDDLAAVVVNCMFAMEYQKNFQQGYKRADRPGYEELRNRDSQQ